jgi:crossover junction endodeoxyribonuclease RusA
VSTFTLPYPPSANKLWRPAGYKLVKTAAYHAYMREAALVIEHQRPEPVAGKFALTVIATRPDNRTRDVDNLLKPTMDAIAKAGVVENDSLAERVVIGWSQEGPLKGGAILVVVEPWTAQVAA